MYRGKMKLVFNVAAALALTLVLGQAASADDKKKIVDPLADKTARESDLQSGLSPEDLAKTKSALVIVYQDNDNKLPKKVYKVPSDDKQLETYQTFVQECGKLADKSDRNRCIDNVRISLTEYVVAKNFETIKVDDFKNQFAPVEKQEMLDGLSKARLLAAVGAGTRSINPKQVIEKYEAMPPAEVLKIAATDPLLSEYKSVLDVKDPLSTEIATPSGLGGFYGGAYGYRGIGGYGGGFYAGIGFRGPYGGGFGIGVGGFGRGYGGYGYGGYGYGGYGLGYGGYGLGYGGYGYGGYGLGYGGYGYGGYGLGYGGYGYGGYGLGYGGGYGGYYGGGYGNLCGYGYSYGGAGFGVYGGIYL